MAIWYYWYSIVCGDLLNYVVFDNWFPAKYFGYDYYIIHSLCRNYTSLHCSTPPTCCIKATGNSIRYFNWQKSGCFLSDWMATYAMCARSALLLTYQTPICVYKFIYTMHVSYGSTNGHTMMDNTTDDNHVTIVVIHVIHSMWWYPIITY